MQQKAFWLAEKWVLSNYRLYLSTDLMWEKYNVIDSHPNIGKGGEYETQFGFGWTNGVVLDLLSTYSDRLHFAGLDTNPDEVAKKVIQREQPKLNFKSIIQNKTEIETDNNDNNNNIYNQNIISQNNGNNTQKTFLSMLFKICILFIGWWLF